MAKTLLDRSVAKELSSMLLPSITIQNGIFLADRKRVPSVGIYEDINQYFDPNEYKIHLGMYGPIEIFKVDNEEDYIAAVKYFFGHENQHVRSTATAPYDNGIKRSAHAIIEYIAAKEGIRKNFRNDRDYEVFVSSDLAAKGINVSMRVIAQICANLMNSVEDGRIERIRALEFPGFEKQRRYFRAIVWNQDYEFKPYADGLDAADKLNLHINNILSLSTTGLYLKGFVAEYGGTEIMDEVKKFIPYIAKGVLAGRTRYMADNVVEIAKLLAPYIYEVSKYEKSAAQEAFEKMLSEMLKQLISQMDPSMMSDTSEREEEQDDGVPMSVFPMSDLVITLDDETYDKLMEKAKKSNSGAGIMVKREHPKEEEKKDEDGKSGSGSSDKKDEGDKKDGDGSGKDSDKSGEKSNGSNSSDGKEDDGQGNSDGQSGQEGNNSSQNSNGQQDNNGSASKSGKNSSKNDEYSKEYSHSEGGTCEGNNNSGSHQSGGGEGGTVEMVLAQMKEAASECRDDVKDAISSINRSVEHTAKNNRGNAPIVKDADKPITKEYVKDICSRGFKELKREYKLDQPLPTLLNARAKAFRKKNERYFRSLSTPNVSHLNSGSVDPTRIYGLAMGDTDVFRKIGNDKKFNGCVYVLVDNSGSMAGNKRTEAAKAAAVIEEGFKGIIPMKIVAFDTCGPIIHEVIKGWDESQKLNCCWNFAKHGRSGCGNDDAKDILVAQRELLTRSEEKKLLIVLSDGAPSDVEAVRNAVADTRKKGINVFSIYFEEGKIGQDAEQFKHMYQKDYVCCELSNVDAELTKLMVKFSRS